jgi:glycosyltransferase involved in cell wall biosynthesis
VLTVARQEPYKLTDLLVRAVAELRNRAMPARLVVVGDGSSLAACRDLAARLGAQEVVAFTGAVDEETLGRWWASASLYATASTQKAYGIALAEALVAGLPVVASDIPAHREVSRRAGPGAAARLRDVDAPDVEAASQFADAIASCSPRRTPATSARRGAPCPAEIVEQLLETLTAAIVSRP